MNVAKEIINNKKHGEWSEWFQDGSQKYIGNYLGTINKNHHGTGVDHSSNKKHNLVSSSLSTINHGRYSKRQRF